MKVLTLENQLKTYIIDVKSSTKFMNLLEINDLVMRLVSTKKNILYLLVYRLITLALLLPILTATMENVFSVMKIVKTRLHNRINYQFFFDCLIKHIEKDAFNSVNNQIIIHYYHENSHRSIMNFFLLLFLNYKLLLVLCLCK